MTVFTNLFRAALVALALVPLVGFTVLAVLSIVAPLYDAKVRDLWFAAPLFAALAAACGVFVIRFWRHPLQSDVPNAPAVLEYAMTSQTIAIVYLVLGLGAVALGGWDLRYRIGPVALLLVGLALASGIASAIRVEDSAELYRAGKSSIALERAALARARRYLLPAVPSGMFAFSVCYILLEWNAALATIDVAGIAAFLAYPLLGLSLAELRLRRLRARLARNHAA
jgi:hypothetical protein